MPPRWYGGRRRPRPPAWSRRGCLPGGMGAGPGGLGVPGEGVRYLRRHGSRMRLGLNVRVHAQVPLLLWGPDTCYSRGKWGPGLTPRWYPDVSRETMTSATSTWSDSPRPSLAPDAFLSSGVSRETPDDRKASGANEGRGESLHVEVADVIVSRETSGYHRGVSPGPHFPRE